MPVASAIPSETPYTLFDTPIGTCAIAWGGRAIVRVQLPEADDGSTIARLDRAIGPLGDTEPPPWVARVIARIAGHLEGDADTLEDVPLALASVSGEFRRRVYETARTVRPGETTTYGELAALAGSPGAARAVGRAMARNPFPLVVPCHRVLAAGQRPGGFSAYRGHRTKRTLLALEGVTLAEQLTIVDRP